MIVSKDLQREREEEFQRFTRSVRGEFGRPAKAASPVEFAQRCVGATQFAAPPHVRLLDKVLVEAADGTLRKRGYTVVVVSMPPRHGKSHICSSWFPAWFLGTYPDKKIILASYEAEFAKGWGRRARDILEEHGEREFGVRVRGDSSASHHWEIEGREGCMDTAGVGGPVTGKGGHVCLIDDPIKNAEEAASMTIREKHWEWYTSTLRTRLEPDATIIAIMTRWHPDDLVGRIVKNANARATADKVLEIRLPAIAEANDPIGRLPGEALWPERYPAMELERIRASVGERVWLSLYQQQPLEIPPGSPVYITKAKDGRDKLIVRKQEFRPWLRCFRGWDWGYLWPFAVIAQIEPIVDDKGKPTGREVLRFLREVTLPNSIVPDFADHVLGESRRLFPTVTEWTDYGDPAGKQRSDKSNETTFDILHAKGVAISSSPTPVERGIAFLQQMIDTGDVEFDPACNYLVNAVRTAYVRDHRGEPVGGMLGHPYADVADAARYLVVGAFGLTYATTGPQSYRRPPVGQASMVNKGAPTAPIPKPGQPEGPRRVEPGSNGHHRQPAGYSTQTVFRPGARSR